jgi:hypothetical protein
MIQLETMDIKKEMIACLELGNMHGEQGDEDTALDYYVKGLQLSRELNDSSRTKQFSNLILTYI